MSLEITLSPRLSRPKQRSWYGGSWVDHRWGEQRRCVGRGSRTDKRQPATAQATGKASLLFQSEQMQNLKDVHGSSSEFSMASYERAMEALSSLITGRKRGAGTDRARKFNRMLAYLKILDLEEHIDGLSIIHVAGSKGKGSTCSFCESILRECGFRTGLFTSPHLVDVRERFRIEGFDISEEKFLQHFWDCWNQLKEKMADDLPMPPLFQFLTLLAFKIFTYEKVDVAIIEVGLGGKWDSTNVIKEPIICGIASLGMDHMEILGHTLEEIASEKAGIFKPQVPAITVPQPAEAMEVLKRTAAELMVPLEVASPLCPKELGGEQLGLSGDHQFINAGLAVALCRSWLQRTSNLKAIFLHERLDTTLPQPFIRGLSNANLAGRAQIVHDRHENVNVVSHLSEQVSDLIFYLDGAHTPESVEVCARWFSKVVMDDIRSYNMKQLNGDNEHFSKVEKPEKIFKQILLFNCMEVRDPQLLFSKLISTCMSGGVQFSKALFVPSMSTYHKVDSALSAVPMDYKKDVSWQFALQRTWEKMIHGKDAIPDGDCFQDNLVNLPGCGFLYQDPSRKCNPESKQFSCSAVFPSLPMTLSWLRDCIKENPSVRLQVLVTGSLHLVGDLLKLLRR